MLRWTVVALTICAACASPAAAAAQEVAVTTVLAGLRGPSGVAIRPGAADTPYDIYVSEGRAGRIVLLRSDAPHTAMHGVTGFAESGRGGPGLPAGLLFLSRTRLAVGLEGAPREACVLLFDLPDEGPLAADRVEQRIGVAAGQQGAADGAANVYALARTLANDRVPDGLIATSYGKENRPGLWRMPVRAGTIDKPTPFADVRQPTLPTAVAVSRQGYVLVALPQEVSGTGGGRLAFYNPIDGSKVMELSLALTNVVGLAYSPRSGNLYAADFGSELASSAAERGGVFRIESADEPGEAACRAIKVADAPRPTALVFGPDGALYVAARNEANAAEEGALLRITGEL